MSEINKRRGIVATTLLLLLHSSPSWADSGGNLDLQSFHPALDSKGMVTVEGSGVLGHLQPSFGLLSNWAHGLLRLQSQENTYEVDDIVSPTLIGSLGIRPFGLEMQLGMAVPFHVVSGDRGPDSEMGTPSDPNDDQNYSFQGQGLGNIQLQLKWRVLDTSHWPVGLALLVGTELPTASESERWLGEQSPSFYVRAAVDRTWGKFGIAANVGLNASTGDSEFVDNDPPTPGGFPAPMTGMRVAAGTSLPVGLGLSYALRPGSFEVIGEVFGEYSPNAENYQPLEALAGIKLYLAENSFLSLGAGAGIVPEQGASPDFRTYLGIVFEPSVGDRDHDGLKDDVDQCPDDPEDYDEFYDSDGCPDPDNDVDGILDVEDDCPLIPEDRDGDEDEDGCPEDGDNDRDLDGILDIQDSCPDDPEDIDSFEDEDGCPDLDNDKDLILDVDDLCPDNAEDYDNFEDVDGCPEADNDNDRILDEDDECPREDGQTAEETSEVYNTVDDDDGCPDRGPVRKIDGVIEVLEKIHFEYDSDVIKEESFSILRAVAMTIETNPDIRIVEVQGHTDERGSATYNRELSQRRANSVVKFLVAKGVDKTRLEAKGYGEDEPKNLKHNKAAWAENRRVEFVIRD